MATGRNLSQEMRRWLRVVTFTLIMLSPAIRLLGKRMRDHVEIRRQEQAAKKALQTRALRSNKFWLPFALSAGLTTAGIAIYRYMQLRRQQQEASENQPIELLPHDRWNGNSLKEQISMAQVAPGTPEPPIPSTSSLPLVGKSRNQPVRQTIPEDATVIGVVSSRLYYPIEVPLEQLASSEDADIVTVVYFSSEDEAQARGFTAARFQ
ncbi:MAG TPA: hypothetical protein VFU49_15980 [Ktedonobacteraceae bacterium]|nr:hypothetical protein [Ktedonobacteraceae bacterium]